MNDFSELDRLEADLRGAGIKAAVAAVAVVKKGAHNVMTEARQNISGLAHAPHYPRSITYDVEIGAGTISAEIGPDKDLPQGALGNLLEYGSANNAPLAHLGPALDREGPEFMRHIGDLGGDIL